VIVTIPDGSHPRAMCRNPARAASTWANHKGSSISILRDSAGGIEGSHTSQALGHKFMPTVVRSSPQGLAFDAMGRRVLNPRSGIFFVRDEGRGVEDVAGRARSVVQR